MMVVDERRIRDALAATATAAETDGLIEFLSPKEAADRLGVKSLSTIYNWLRDGYIEAYRIAGRWRIPAVRLDAVENAPEGYQPEEEYALSPRIITRRLKDSQ